MNGLKILKNSKKKIIYSEFLGSCFLVMIVVGSGIMAQNLTDDFAVMLLANTIATGAGLFVLITVFSDISGAHFNPFVSLSMVFTGKLKFKLIHIYIFSQISGCLVGVGLANFFFELPIYELSSKTRDGIYIFVAEIVATFGLILVIFGSMKSGKEEANEFIKQPFMQDAVRLRKYDDLAKIENLEIPNINYFYKHVERSFK